VEVPQTRQLVLSDPYRLNQVLLNLLTNSLKFTDQGNITLACRVREETAEALTVSFQVTDTGLGVPPEKQEAIFASFSQASADTTRRYGGTGLGLTISCSLVEQLGGHLSMCSVPGQGSTFGFTLTFEKAPQNSLDEYKTTASPDPDLAAAVRGCRVLLVEDHDVNRQLVQLILANHEVLVDAAANGPAALQLFDEHSYHLILMDIQMPGMSGLEVTAAIRQSSDPSKARIPIIAS
jgi:CheY-like chemotaxis protein